MDEKNRKPQVDTAEAAGTPAAEKDVRLTEQESLFLQLANDPVTRSTLLARLEKLGLLSAFLEAENGTRR